MSDFPMVARLNDIEANILSSNVGGGSLIVTEVGRIVGRTGVGMIGESGGLAADVGIEWTDGLVVEVGIEGTDGVMAWVAAGGGLLVAGTVVRGERRM